MGRQEGAHDSTNATSFGLNDLEALMDVAEAWRALSLNASAAWAHCNKRAMGTPIRCRAPIAPGCNGSRPVGGRARRSVGQRTAESTSLSFTVVLARLTTRLTGTRCSGRPLLCQLQWAKATGAMRRTVSRVEHGR